MTHLALVPVPPVAHLDGVSQHYGKTVALNNITLDIPARCMADWPGRRRKIEPAIAHLRRTGY